VAHPIQRKKKEHKDYSFADLKSSATKKKKGTGRKETSGKKNDRNPAKTRLIKDENRRTKRK